MDIKKLLSHPVSSVLCFLISLLASIAIHRIFLQIAADKFALVLLTRNFLHGHGFTIESVNLSDLSQKIYLPFHGWPPGYNLLLAPFLATMEDNYMLAGFLADIFLTVIFFIYLRKLLLQIGFPVWLTNLFLLFKAFFIHSYTISANPTDFAGTTFLLAAIFHILKFTSATAPPWKQLAATIFFFCAAALTRYQYMPVVVMLGLFLAIQGRIYKNKQWIKAGFITAGVTLVTFTALLAYQKMTAGQFAFMTPANKGFYPANLLELYPFITKAFINLNFYATQLSLKFNTSYSLWVDIAIIPTLLFLIYLLTLAWVWFTKKTTIQKASVSFRLFGGMAALLVMGVLVILALTQSTENIPPLFGWTYIEEARYFAFPALFVQIIAWQWLFAEKASSLIKKILRWLLIVTAVFEMLHGAYYIAKKYSGPMTPIQKIPWKVPEMTFLRKYMEEQQKNDRHLIVTGFSKKFSFTAGLHGGAGMYTPAALNTTMPRSAEPATLLVVLRKEQLPFMQSFLKQPGVRPLQKIGYYYFYELYVEPGAGK